jgi:phage-related protein
LFVAQTYVFGNQITVALGRVLGQIASVIMTLFYPIQRFFEKTIEWIKYFTLRILDYFVPIEKIIDSFKSAPKDVGKSINEIAEEALAKMGFRVRDLSNANREFAVSLTKLTDEQRKRILSATSVMERWVLVFAIVMEFIKLYIIDIFNEIWDKTKKIRTALFDLISNFYITFKNLIVDIVSGLIGGLSSVLDLDLVAEYLQSLANLWRSIMNLFGEESGNPIQAIFYMLGQALGYILNGLLFLFRIVTDALSFVLDLLVPVMQGLVNILPDVVDVFVDIFNLIWDFFVMVFEFIRVIWERISFIPKIVISFISSIWNNFIDPKGTIKAVNVLKWLINVIVVLLSFLFWD